MSGFGRFIAFSCAARHGSFAQAGRELALTPSTVAKRINSLESELGGQAVSPYYAPGPAHRRRRGLACPLREDTGRYRRAGTFSSEFKH